MAAIEPTRIGDFLKRIRRPINIEDQVEYQLVTIKMHHKGVIPRTKKVGSSIGTKKMYRVKAGDFILSGIDARNGAFGIVPQELDEAVVTNDFWYFEVDESVIDKRLFLELTATSWFDEICRLGSDGTTQRIRLQKDKFFSQEIPLPTIGNQKHLLNRLLSFKGKSASLQAEITDQQTLLKKLRQSILQNAIQGKLTADWRKAHPDTEPAADLLQRIQAEKQTLLDAKKIRKQKPLPPINPKEIPFDIPEGWAWCRLGEVLSSSDAGKSPHCEKRPALKNEWGVLTTTAIQLGSFDENADKVLPNGFNINQTHILEENDLLITRAGPTNRTGICCKVRFLTQKLILSDKTIRLKYCEKVAIPDFLVEALNSDPIRELLLPKMTGMAESQVNISQTNLKLTVTTQVHATCELSSLELSQTLALSRTKNKFIFIWARSFYMSSVSAHQH